MRTMIHGDARSVEVAHETWPIAGSFRLSRSVSWEVDVVTVTVWEGQAVGRGEGRPYIRYGEQVDTVVEQLVEAAHDVAGGLDRKGLQAILRPGAARNAMDCALWEVEAAVAGRPVWQLAGLPEPTPRVTTLTLSLDAPEKMGARAAAESWRELLKIKLGGPDGFEGDLARLRAVRAAAPGPQLVVDVNEGWSDETYRAMAPHLVEARVTLLEQPVPADADTVLRDGPRPVPVCADESCHTRGHLARLAGRYDFVNVKLDKTGGLTEALNVVAAARARGFGVMVGSMVSTSLAVAPAVLLGAAADLCDLDGAQLLRRDRPHALVYAQGTVAPPSPKLWGGPAARGGA
jgi:L-alanine-DL-glutamate epimerase-like enolase superfamily enzyme